MSTPCEKCENPSEISPGSASIRPEFRQPTMYDHMEMFSKYKEAKALAKKLKAAKEELLKFNPRFTDLQLDTKDEDEVLEKFSTQDVAKFRGNLKRGRISFKPEVAEPFDLWKSRHELKPVASLRTISRTPVYCPVSKCHMTMGVTSVLSHFLLDHKKEKLGVQCQNLYAGERSFLLFDRNDFLFEDNVCLGVLPYGGIESQEDSRPAIRGICKPNSFLSTLNDFAHLENHLPILVMACKTSVLALLGDKSLLNRPVGDPEHLLIIWLASAQTTKHIFCTITAFDRSMTTSRSTIVQVRSLGSPQNPHEFLSEDTNFLMLNEGELDILSENGTTSVNIEIKIHEFEE